METNQPFSNQPTSQHTFIMFSVIVAILLVTIGLAVTIKFAEKDIPAEEYQTFGDRLRNNHTIYEFDDMYNDVYPGSLAQPLRLEDLETTTSTWQNRFHTGSIPLNAFQTYFFDTANPTRVVAETVMPYPNAHYRPGNGLLAEGIAVTNLGAYWIGNIAAPTETTYAITANFSGDVRIIIDGHILPQLRESMYITLQGGQHTIEVEFVGGDDYATAQLILTDIATLISDRETLSTHIANNTSSTPYDVWYTFADGAYDPNAAQNVHIANKATRPTILILDSYEAVDWNVTGLNGSNITHVIYSSKQIGSRVTLDTQSITKLHIAHDLLPAPDGYGTYPALTGICWSDSYPPRCDNITTVLQLHTFTQSLTGGELTGFSAGVDSMTPTMTIPQTVLNADKRQDIQDENNRIRAKAEMEAKNTQNQSDVETLFAE